MGIFVFSAESGICIFSLSRLMAFVFSYRHKDSKTTADHFERARKNKDYTTAIYIVLTYAHLWGILGTDKSLVRR